ncbi:MAG: hypothetical protein Q7R85_02470, partial [bacterium]|nr:hypothetical protein [bacterium]
MGQPNVRTVRTNGQPWRKGRRAMGIENGTGRDQSIQVMAVLGCNAKWDNVLTEVAQRIINNPKGSGEQFTRFLQNGGVCIPLTPTTFGSEIKPPFEDEGGWDIIADGPGDDLLDVANIQQLPMLNEGE